MAAYAKHEKKQVTLWVPPLSTSYDQCLLRTTLAHIHKRKYYQSPGEWGAAGPRNQTSSVGLKLQIGGRAGEQGCQLCLLRLRLVPWRSWDHCRLAALAGSFPPSLQEPSFPSFNISRSSSDYLSDSLLCSKMADPELGLALPKRWPWMQRCHGRRTPYISHILNITPWAHFWKLQKDQISIKGTTFSVNEGTKQLKKISWLILF